MANHCVSIKHPEIQELANITGLHPAIVAAKAAIWQEKNNTLDSFPKASDIIKPSEIKFSLRSAEILVSDKAKQIFEKGQKNSWTLDKILTELNVPKEQKAILVNLGTTNREELLTSLLADYSYSVEVNTTQKFDLAPGEEPDVDYELIEDEDGNIIDTQPVSNTPVINSNYYSNLTVPGGTNYTENEISTPLITPSIKGHAQFSTDNGIGWFRSDDKIEFLDKEDLIKKGIIKQVPCG